MGNLFYHLKITIRNLRRDRMYSIINILGLAVSLTAVLFILFWVNDEMSFNKFYKQSDNIYLSVSSFDTGNKQVYWGVSSLPLAATVKSEIPEVINACRLVTYWRVENIRYGENIFSDVNCSLVDSSFFSIFDFNVKDGDAQNLLPDKNSVVLSESVAKVLFGKEKAIGKTIIDDSSREFHVTGVIADIPENSSNRYNVIFSFSFFEYMEPSQKEEWNRLDYKTYFLLRPGTNANDVATKITDIHAQHEQWPVTYLLQPLVKEHFYDLDGTPNSNLQACRLFSIAVAVLLLIACINYVNLVTARSSRRNKEVRVRSILGARKSTLFAYFFNESLLLVFCSLILAVALLYLLSPLYSLITGKQSELDIFSMTTLTLFGLTFIITSLFTGFYPALIQSKLTKGIQNAVGGRYGIHALIRKTLVVLQFSVSTILIIGALTINLQLQYIKSKNPGYNKEHIFNVKLTKGTKEQINAIKSQLSQNPSIAGAFFTSERLNNVGSYFTGGEWEEKGDKNITFTMLRTDKNFIPIMGIEFVEGGNFTETTAENAGIIINKEAVEQMGIEKPIGKQIQNMGGVSGTIIGVTENFHFKNMYEKISPLVITASPGYGYMYVQVIPGKTTEALTVIKNIYKEYSPDVPFDYTFVDEEFDMIYKNDIRTNQLINAFALIAILVSCLGLFGLVTFTAETKTKEIGIRKVLGAKVRDIVGMLSKEFIVLVGIAILISFPLAYYWMENMLQDFAYRIDLSWWMFALAAFITIALTLLTVCLQAIKAATANPVKSLKTE